MESKKKIKKGAVCLQPQGKKFVRWIPGRGLNMHKVVSVIYMVEVFFIPFVFLH